MERTLGLDVHAQSCTLAVPSQAGKRLRDLGVETNGQALIEAIRTIPGRKHLCIEESTQSAWLCEILKSPQTYARLRELARSHRSTVRDRTRRRR